MSGLVRRRLEACVRALALALAAAAPAYAAFEDVGAGARAPGMGNAFTAIADDVYTVFYNPAGLGTLDRMQFGATYAKLFTGLTDGSSLGQSELAFASPLKAGRWGTLGVSLQDFKLDTIYNERALGISWGKLALQRENNAKLYWGLQIRNLSHGFDPPAEAANALSTPDPSLSSPVSPPTATGLPDPLLSGANSKSAMGLDVGFLYRTPRRLSIGLAIANLNQPDVSFAGGSDKLPREIRLGLGYKLLWMNVATEARLQSAPDGTQDKDILVGAERYFPSLERGQFGVRASVATGSRSFRQVTAGLSYKINKIQADYAFIVPLGTIKGTSGTHRLGLTLHFGAPSPEEEYAAEMVSQMQRTRERVNAGLAYQFEISSAPTSLDRPDLAEVRRLVLAGRYQEAHQAAIKLLMAKIEDSGLHHLARRLDAVAAFYPSLTDPTEHWQKVLVRGTLAFLENHDRDAVLLLAYARSLDTTQETTDRYLSRVEEMTEIKAERPTGDKNLWEIKHKQAEDAYAAKSYQEAMTAVQQALILEPDDLKALKRWGTNLYFLEDFRGALAMWQRALALETDQKEKDLLQKRIAEVEKALTPGPKETQRKPVPEESRPKSDPREIEALYQKGLEHYARGEKVLATAAFERILYLDPENVPAQKALDRIRRSEP